MLPFSVVIPQAERDPRLLEKLKAEAEGVLSWTVRGCLDWQAQGLNPPEIVRHATQEYRDESDSVALFMKACCEKASNEWVTKDDLWLAYGRWCHEDGHVSITKHALGTWLKKAGFDPKQRESGQRVWKGIRLKPDLDWE
jgi:putative DNA primase/helicase